MAWVTVTNQDGVQLAIDTDVVSAIVPVPGLEGVRSFVRGSTLRNLIVATEATALVTLLGLDAYAVPLSREDGLTTWYAIASKVQTVQFVSSTVSEVCLAPSGTDRIRASGSVAAIVAILNTASVPLDPLSVWPSYGTIRSLAFSGGFTDLFTPGGGAFPISNTSNGSNSNVTGVSAASGDRMGVVACATGTTAAGRAYVGAAAAPMYNAGLARMRSDVNVPTASDGVDTFLAYVGFVDSFTAEPTNGFYFRFDFATIAGNWQAVSRVDGVTVAAVDTGVPGWEATGLAYRCLELELTPNGGRWAINGAIGATIADVPTTIARTFGPTSLIRKTLGGNSRTLNVDIFGIRQTGLSAR